MAEEDLLFHVCKAVTAVKNDRFTVFLKSAQGQYFLCSCTVQPPNFRARLSHIRRSDTFTTYSYFCIVTQGKIQGLNQIGVNASAAGGKRTHHRHQSTNWAKEHTGCEYGVLFFLIREFFWSSISRFDIFGICPGRRQVHIHLAAPAPIA